MRFQTTETVPIADAEQVLRALEVSLGEFSDRIEREGHRIILRGLGPSPRARNYRDTAIFDVLSSNGSTTISADVSFQASALLAGSAQDLVVREKLEYAFGQMRAQLNLGEAVPFAAQASEPFPVEELFTAQSDDRFGEPADESAGVPSGESAAEHFKPIDDLAEFDEFGQSVFARAQAAAARIDEPASRSIADRAVEPAPDPAAEPEKERSEENTGLASVAAGEPEPISVPLEVPKPESLPSADLQSSSQISPVASSVPLTLSAQLAVRVGSGMKRRAVLEQQRPELPALDLSAAGTSYKTGVPILIVSMLAVAVAAGSVYLYWAGRSNPGFAQRMIADQPAPQPAAPVAVVPVPEPQPRHEEPNPKVWLEEWAAAMRGRDPDLQASFYADPVVHYLEDSNVSKDRLTTSFRSAIQARDGVWTVKLEKISVNPQTSSYLIVRLTKHFMQLDDSSGDGANQIADRFVRSRLELRRINQEWKIVSERDVASPNTQVMNIPSRF